MSNTQMTAKRVPLQEGLFNMPDDANANPQLVASKCAACDLVFFPQRKFCGKCASANLNPVQLSNRGKVFTYSLITRTSKMSLIEAPYVQVEVAFPEGTHAISILRGCEPEEIKIGLEVETVLEKIKTDADGSDMVSFVFRKVS